MNRLKELRKKKGYSQKQLADILFVNQTAVSQWERGVTHPNKNTLLKLCELYNVTIDYIFGREQATSITPLPPDDEWVVIDLIASVAAGYNHFADTDIIEMVTIPKFMLKGYPVKECHMITVKGDSMYPNYMNGDKVVFHSQTSVDSDSIAVIQYNGDEFTLKKVRYKTGENWMELIPINPMYPPVRIENEDLEKCRVIGLVLSSMRV